MVQRLTYRRTLSYNTSSNRRKIVKTPGGKLVYQHISKAVCYLFINYFKNLFLYFLRPKHPNAVTLASPSAVSRPVVHVNWLNTQSARRLSPAPTVAPSHVSAFFVFSLIQFLNIFLAGAVRARIIRAFLIEEQKIVVKVLKAKQQAQAAAK